MTYEQKLNSITRLVLILILLSYFYNGNLRIIMIGVITIFAIFLMHYFHNKEKDKREYCVNVSLKTQKKVLKALL